MKKLLMVFAGAMSAMVASAETIAVTQANFESHRTLLNGNTYLFAEDIGYTARETESAMTVADGANVIIEIAKGVTVNLTGGDASGTTGAGAGIEVPENAKLIIGGAGKLYAVGGAGANGTNGGKGVVGLTGDYEDKTSDASSGGAGGNGGGGAGAGIGGIGGTGGAGGAGGAAFTAKWNSCEPGKDGGGGVAGGKGAPCGTVEIRGSVSVFGRGGAAGAGGQGGPKTDWRCSEGATYYWAAYGAGGGGGGAGGCSGADIGGGGGGGAGGGGGGGGGLSYDSSCYDIITFTKNGLGGEGGHGGDDGGKGADRTNESTTYDGYTYNAQTTDDGYGHGGNGGAGGAAGARGGDGSLTVELTASCGCGTRSAYNVGKISDTEYIRWENEKLWRVKDGVYTEIAYETVQGWMGDLNGGKWYVVKGVVNRADTINVGEVANLVLLDRAALTVDCGQKDKQTGILVLSGRALNIFGVESGSLTATGGGLAAGIGGGKEQTMGALTIYGGTVSATGGDLAAGIGGGYAGAGGSVTINGGTVTATGGQYGAGIGGGEKGECGTVTINGGTVTAKGGEKGAGIGPGCEGGNGGTVTINGGEVTASSFPVNLKLGPRVFKITNNYYQESWYSVSFRLPSYLRLSSVVNEDGSTFQVSTQDGITFVYALSISSATLTFDLTEPGYRFTESNAITVEPFYRDEVLSSDDLPQVKVVALSFAVPDSLCLVSAVADNGTQVKTETVNGVTSVFSFPDCRVKLTFVPSEAGYLCTNGGVVTIDPFNEDTSLDKGKIPNIEADPFSGSVEYLLADGNVATTSGVRRIEQAIAQSNTVPSGWYIVVGDVTNSSFNIQGTVNLILADGATLTVNGGIQINGGDGNALNIFCQRGTTGRLITTGSEYRAGIGVNGTLTINGGEVTAIGGYAAAAIGGNEDAGQNGPVTINGGTVTAFGGKYGAGIGGGSWGQGGSTTINGGTVTAIGGEVGGAGIGGGNGGQGGTVTINGGTVTATGRSGGAGIGSGNGRQGGSTTINGGSVKANIYGQPLNGSEEKVYCVTIDGCETSREITGLPDYYGLKDVVPIEKKHYFYLPNGEYSLTIDDFLAKATVNDGPAAVKVTYNGEVTIFDDGLHYLESSNSAFIDTGYKPTVDARIVADMNPLAKAENWLVFFGVTSGDSSKDGILLRYSDGDSINGWFCNDDHAQAKIGGLQNKRFTAELKSGGMTLNEQFAEITTTGTPYNGSIYLLCGNNGGSAWRHQQMRLYSFKIYDTVDEVETLVCDFVPARAVEYPAIVGLYDRVTMQLYINHGSGSFTLGCDEPTGPTCEGGEIAEGEGVEWIVTPNAGVEAVTITGLSEEATLVVKLNGYNVPSEAFMGFGEGGVFSLALNPEVVTPKIGELDEGEPFVVGAGEVTLTIKTIPGLKYSLIRGAELGKIDTTVVTTPATSAETTLKDSDPPTGNAFYHVGVEK